MNSSEEIKALLTALKMVLKSKGITYKSLAKSLRLSEASVKRMFSQQEMSLGRFAEICHLIKVPLDEVLALSANKQKRDFHTYTDAQEQAFSSDLYLLAFFDHLLQNYSVAQIHKRFGVSMTTIRKRLRTLESLGLIEVHANDKIRFMIPVRVQWQKNGPLRKKLLPLAQEEFLKSYFDSEKNDKQFLSVKITEQSLKRFQVQINELISEINKLASIENLTSSDQCIDAGFLFASRPWKFSVLEKLK